MTASSRRAARPEDVYRLRVPTDPRLAPDATSVVAVVREATVSHDGYRSAIWRMSLDRPAGTAGGVSTTGTAERLTLGAKNDSHPRFAPDGRALAFLSDRGPIVEDDPTAPRDREDAVQVHLLPLDRPGEARRLTDLPRGVDAFAWSPDGSRLAVISSSRGTSRRDDDRARRRLSDPGPTRPPTSDYWFFDRLNYQFNGAGVIAGHVPQLWIVDVAGGEARRVTNLPAGVGGPSWSPDGRRVALVTGRARDHDLASVGRVIAVDVESGAMVALAEHRHGFFHSPLWLADGREVAVIGGDLPHVFYRSDIWVFPGDGSDAAGGRNVSGRHDVMPGSVMNSDVAVGEDGRLHATRDGRALVFTAPKAGSFEVWRLDLADGRLDQLSDDRHFLSAIDVVDRGRDGLVVAAVRSTPTTFPEVHVGGVDPTDARRPGRSAHRGIRFAPVSSLNGALADEVDLRPAVPRATTVDGREIHGWLIAGGDGARPTVVEIHGGPHTLYGWAPMLEFQVLAAAGMSVFYCNPRGSEGYGRDFNEANLVDWGDGPMRDVLASVDALVADGLADASRLGVTGGSYGGYLTNWIVAHDHRFAAALTARCVSDLTTLMLTGDLGGTDWAKVEFGAYPWEDPDLFRRQSPLTYAPNIRTPLLIQHAEQDLRTTIGQAEALFSVLRKHRRPVRMMRVPGESHELTRSGTPFRRAENLVQVRDWFAHFLVAGRQTMPRMPRTRHGE